MSMLTQELAEKFRKAYALATDLSEEEKLIFNHAINITALNQEKNPHNIRILEAMAKESEQNLNSSIKQLSSLRSLLSQLIAQSEAVTPQMVKILENWALSFLSLGKTLSTPEILHPYFHIE